MDHAGALRSKKHCQARNGRQILVLILVAAFGLTIFLGSEVKQLYVGHEWLVITGVVAYGAFETLVMVRSVSLYDALMRLTPLSFLTGAIVLIVLWPARPSPIVFLFIPFFIFSVITFITAKWLADRWS